MCLRLAISLVCHRFVQIAVLQQVLRKKMLLCCRSQGWSFVTGSLGSQSYGWVVEHLSSLDLPWLSRTRQGGDVLGQPPLFFLLLKRRHGTMHASLRFPYISPGPSSPPGLENLARRLTPPSSRPALRGKKRKPVVSHGERAREMLHACGLGSI